MKNSKKVLTVLVIAFLLIGVCSAVFATEFEDEEVTIIPNSRQENNVVNYNTTNQTNTNVAFNSLNTNANTNTSRNTNTNTNTAKNTNTNNSSTYSNLPKAGSSDNIVLIAVIALFGVSALYAYKKIKDYNIK
ncbi:MAG: LPXTG cell wall anchor domain-containing protein [Clostridia bacterium]|nr:LPXTG cell wall anchor domain-containing protein [Clostridia bacterium]